jgi:recombinational DNA repair protein (RecF pathway)
VRGVEMVRPPHRLAADLEGILLGCYLAEHALVFAPENEANELLFRLLDATVEALVAGVDRNLAARYFEQWALRLAGVFPPPRECPLCGSDLAAGAILPRGGDALLCRSCAGASAGVPLDADAVAFLLRAHREALPAIAASSPSASVLARVEQVCGEVRRGFLQHELKSYDVMQRTLSSVPVPIASPTR